MWGGFLFWFSFNEGFRFDFFLLISRPGKGGLFCSLSFKQTGKKGFFRLLQVF